MLFEHDGVKGAKRRAAAFRSWHCCLSHLVVPMPALLRSVFSCTYRVSCYRCIRNGLGTYGGSKNKKNATF